MPPSMMSVPMLRCSSGLMPAVLCCQRRKAAIILWACLSSSKSSTGRSLSFQRRMLAPEKMNWRRLFLMLRMAIPRLLKLSFYGRYLVSNVLARERRSGSRSQGAFRRLPVAGGTSPVSLQKRTTVTRNVLPASAGSLFVTTPLQWHTHAVPLRAGQEIFS